MMEATEMETKSKIWDAGSLDSTALCMLQLTERSGENWQITLSSVQGWVGQWWMVHNNRNINIKNTLLDGHSVQCVDFETQCDSQ